MVKEYEYSLNHNFENLNFIHFSNFYTNEKNYSNKIVTCEIEPVIFSGEKDYSIKLKEENHYIFFNFLKYFAKPIDLIKLKDELFEL